MNEINTTNNNNFSFTTEYATELVALEVPPLSISGRYYRLTNIYKAFGSLCSQTHSHFSSSLCVCMDYYCPFWRCQDRDPGLTPIYWYYSMYSSVARLWRRKANYLNLGKHLILAKEGSGQTKVNLSRSLLSWSMFHGPKAPEALLEMNFRPHLRPGGSESEF